MKLLNIGIDLDGTLWPVLPRWVASLNDRHDLSVSVDDITDYDITLFFPSLTKEQIYEPLNDERFWGYIEAYNDGLYFVVKQLAYGHSVKIVSASCYKHIPSKFKRFFECFPMFNWDDVVITSDKKSVKMDLLVDDCFDNLSGNCGYHKILINKPYNLKYEAETHGIIRVNDLYHAHEVIQGISGEDILC